MWYGSSDAAIAPIGKPIWEVRHRAAARLAEYSDGSHQRLWPKHHAHSPLSGAAVGARSRDADAVVVPSGQCLLWIKADHARPPIN